MNKINDNKKKIIASSVKLFKKYGFENVTINQIINDSKTSKGTFYHYFKAKDDLLTYILDKHDEEIKTFMRALPNDVGAFDIIKMLVRFILKSYKEDNNKTSINNAKHLYHTQLVSSDKFILKEDRYIYVLFSDLVTTAIKNGEIRAGIEPKEVVSNLMVLLRGMLFNWYLCETQFDIVEKGCYLINLYLNDIRQK